MHLGTIDLPVRLPPLAPYMLYVKTARREYASHQKTAMPAKQIAKTLKNKVKDYKQVVPTIHKSAQERGKKRAHRAVRNAVSPYLGPNYGSMLAKQMAIPETADGLVRLPTPDMPRTAQIRVTTTHTMRNAVTAVNNPSFSQYSGDIVVLTYGLPGFSHMYGPVANTNPLNGTLQLFTYADNNSGPTPAGVFPLTRTTMQPGSSVSTNWTPTRNVSFASSNNNVAKPLGLSGSIVYAWFDPGEKIVLVFNEAGSAAATIPVAFTTQVFRWIGPGEAIDNVATLSYQKGATGTNSWTVPMSGWYALSFVVSAVDTDTITALLGVSVTSQASVANPNLMILVSQEPIENPDVGESIRRTAYSMLITNTSAEINKQGTIIAARLVNDGLWSGVSEMSVSHLDRAADKYTGPAQHGCYTYMDFEQSNEQFFQAHMGEGTYSTSGPCFNLELYGYVHMIRITNPTAATLSNDFLVTVTAIYEFRSDSMLFTKDVPQLEYEALIAARRVNNSTPYFYENPLHLGDIWGHIKSAFNNARRAAIPIGMAASALYPEAAGVIMPVARAFQK